eukprot:7957906-Prorocentrum_lima.AAC.1
MITPIRRSESGKPTPGMTLGCCLPNWRGQPFCHHGILGNYASTLNTHFTLQTHTRSHTRS